jgi:uncharacterized membrane protein
MDSVTVKTVARCVLSAVMVAAGVLHFLRPAFFVQIVPSYLPDPGLLVAVSGLFELLGGIGLLVPFSRRWSSYGLIALYVAVFPANLNMAMHADRFAQFPAMALWIRLPLQVVLIGWAWAVGRAG